ncbi:hypothetical protein DFH08DRAFT_1027651 [Mycena albidolilacea]|uniref:Uncharacterized protein n=1 Tax=Mycena albidolilacea TaxID=1033008 RepID=A0AAD7EIY4_9AGAR|nr:hypothetical protein DFH08DRAFT_1027651 [Mycena albidolilacea]
MFSALIAFTFALLLSFSRITIRGAPVATTAVVSLVQVCSDVNRKGVCIPMAMSVNSTCTNINTPPLSLIMGADNDCAVFQEPNCHVGTGAVGEYFLGNPDATFISTADEFLSSTNLWLHGDGWIDGADIRLKGETSVKSGCARGVAAEHDRSEGGHSPLRSSNMLDPTWVYQTIHFQVHSSSEARKPKLWLWLDGGFGFGLRLVKPKPGLDKQNFLCEQLMNNLRVSDCFPTKPLLGWIISGMILTTLVWPPKNGSQARAQAQAKPSQALPLGLGMGLTDFKPKPAQAKPKPWFQSQAKPEHHYHRQVLCPASRVTSHYHIIGQSS